MPKGRKKKQSHYDYYKLGGAFLGVWGAINTYLSMTRYGLEVGMYFWFCNLALFGTAWGLWKRNRSVLIAFLGVACFTQTFWIVDNLWRLTTGTNLFGLVEFMYHPGMPLDEFVLSHYHYFIIPISLLGLCTLKKKEDYSLYVIVTLNLLIFGISYYIFPKEQNLNCIHEPCMGLFPVAGKLYSLGFFLFVLSGNILASYGLGRVFPLRRLKIAVRKQLNHAFIGLCAFGIFVTAIDIHYKNGLPSFRCVQTRKVANVEIGCRYTQEWADDIMILVYSIKNPLKHSQVCTSHLNLAGKKDTLHSDIYIEPGQTLQIPVLLSYPKEDVVAQLSANCFLESGSITHLKDQVPRRLQQQDSSEPIRHFNVLPGY